MGELYKLDFPNGKSYIGITTGTAKKRFAGHRRGARGQKKCSLLARAWAKYGEPTLVVLAVLRDDELAAAEIRAIKAFGSLHPGGYNILEGGQVSPMKNPEVSDKVKASEGWINSRKSSLEAATNANRNRVVSEETKRKMSEAHKRRWATIKKDDVRERLSQAAKIQWERKKNVRTRSAGSSEGICK